MEKRLYKSLVLDLMSADAEQRDRDREREGDSMREKGNLSGEFSRNTEPRINKPRCFNFNRLHLASFIFSLSLADTFSIKGIIHVRNSSKLNSINSVLPCMVNFAVVALSQDMDFKKRRKKKSPSTLSFGPFLTHAITVKQEN